jgi:hypothetical protein
MQENIRATTQREHRERRSGQPEFEFGLDNPSSAFQEERSQQLWKAEARIIELLKKGPMLYETLQPLILQMRLVWNSDLNKILIDGRRAGQILIDGLGPRERTPKPGCWIRLRSS